MYQIISQNKKLIAGVSACLLLAAISLSFQNSPFGPLDKLDTLTEIEDTIPAKPEKDKSAMSISDFDHLIQHIDKEILKMNEHITAMDFEKIHREVNASLNKVDFNKINKEIDAALRNLDVAKIEKGVQSALKEIDWSTIDKEVKKGLLEAKNEIEQINLSQLKKEIEQARLEIEKSKKELKKINVDEVLKYANAGIASAREEMRLTKEMFNSMEKDGLINQQEGFSIEFRDKNLFINGKQQPEKVREKYRHYIKGEHFKITISKQ